MDVAKFKSFIVTAVDSSIIDIPNRSEAKWEFQMIQNLTIYTATARLSCMVDESSDFIIFAKITNTLTDANNTCIMASDDVKNKIDLTHTISTYDSFYNHRN